MRIYLAGPLFCEAERVFNAQLAARMEAIGFSVFLPQRDGVESWILDDEKLSGDALRRKIFAVDRNEILKADVFLFVLDGRVPDGAVHRLRQDGWLGRRDSCGRPVAAIANHCQLL